MKQRFWNTAAIVILLAFCGHSTAQAQAPDPPGDEDKSEPVTVEQPITSGHSIASRQWNFMAKPVVDALGAVIYTSPLSVMFAAIFNTDSNMGGAFQASNYEAQANTANQMHSEARFLDYLRTMPDGEERVRQFIACKAQLMAVQTNNQQMKEPEAFAKCMGGWITTAPDVDGNLKIDQVAEIATRMSKSYPSPKQAQSQDESGTYDPTSDTPCTKHAKEEACHTYRLWNYIYHSYKPDLKAKSASKWGKEKWAYIEEVTRLLGDVEFLLMPAKALVEANANPEEVRLAKELGAGKKEIKVIEPTVKTVKFEAKGQAKEVDLGSYGLMFAQNLQDAYGSMYAVVYKMCQWKNAINTWARSQSGAGFKASCPFWGEKITTKWTGTDNCSADAGSEVYEGASAAGKKIWQKRADAKEWYGGRFYEIKADQSEQETVPTIHGTLGRLSAGTVQFSHLDAMVMFRIVKAELEKDDNGDYACEGIIEEIALGDILDLVQVSNNGGGGGGAPSENDEPMRAQIQNQGSASSTLSKGSSAAGLGKGIKFNYTKEGGANKYRPATADWPIVSKIGGATGSTPAGQTEKDWVINKRVQMFYNYANAVAFYRTYSAINHWLSGLRQSVLSNHRFADKYRIALALVFKGINDTGHGNAIAQALLVADDSLHKQRLALYAHVKTIESKASLAAAVKNSAGKKASAGSGGSS